MAEAPKTGVAVLRRLEESGTGREKLDAGLSVLKAMTAACGRVVTAVEFYEKCCGNPKADPPEDPLLPDGTLTKIRCLLETGEPYYPSAVVSAKAEFADELSALEKKPGEVKAPPASPKGKSSKVEFVGQSQDL